MRSYRAVPIGIDKTGKKEDKDIFIRFAEGYIYYIQNGKYREYVLRKWTGSEIRSQSFSMCYKYYVGSYNRERIYA